MQILDLVFYSHDGRNKILPFNPGGLNIISGISSTGKTALIEVIDYCLGKDECDVPERGPLRNCVSWFGIRILLNNEQFFIARKNPGPLFDKDARVYFLNGKTVNIPDRITEQNNSINSVTNILSSKIGIYPNLTLPWPSIHSTTKISLRESVTYCYQQQNEIASKNIMFHRQEEFFRQSIIKHALPYFLGAISDDVVKINYDLLRSRRQLDILRKDLREALAIQGEGLKKAIRLFSEAQSCGLSLPNDELRKLDDYIVILKQIAEWTPDRNALPGQNRLDELQEEGVELRRKLDELDDKISIAKSHDRDFQDYTTELTHSQFRLKPIGLFEKLNGESKICPFCFNPIQTKTPVLDSLSKSLEHLDLSLSEVEKQRPDIQSLLEDLQNQKDDIIGELGRNTEKIKGVLNQQQEIKKLQNITLQRVQVVAKIKFWLDSVEFASSTSTVRKEIAAKEYEIQQLENLLNEDRIWSNVDSILLRINQRISDWTRELNLEHSEYPVRLDPHQLTVVLEGNEEYHDTPLKNIGSGKNWLGYHLATHFALHEYFLKKRRPVPHFLFLDQPSQVFFSNEKHDFDYDNVYDMYRFIIKTCQEIGTNFQLLVTDHARFLDNPEISKYVKLTLTEESKIIPADWLENKVNV